MGKGGSTTTNTSSSVDPNTRRFIEQFRAAALGNLNTGPNAATSGAQDAFGQLAGAIPGALETGLTGVEQFFDPFQSQVIAGIEGDIGRARTSAQQRAADVSTRAGAFGGDRSAILEGELTRGVNEIGANTLAGARSGGFNNAVNQLLAERSRLGGLGLAGAGGLLGVGQQLDAGTLAKLQALIPGFTPTSQTGETVEQTDSDFLSQLLGAGATIGGFALGGPAGAAVGSGLTGGSIPGLTRGKLSFGDR